jgi:two-component system chemotaxis response regulator CheY
MPELVLIVDDTPLARTVLRKIVESGGYRTAEAGSTQEAILAYRIERPNIVTMDLLMEGHDGLVAIQALRHMDPTVKIVVCSATSDPNYVAAAVKLQVEAVLHKPVEAEKLLATIRGALAKSS